MGMYSSLEGTANLDEVNGLPNVGQYGWTSFEIENYKQLVDYVTETKQYADSVKADRDYVESMMTVIDSVKSDIDSIYNQIKNEGLSIKGFYTEISQWYSQISAMTEEVRSARTEIATTLGTIRDILNQVISLHNSVQVMKTAIEISEANAKTSETNAKDSETKSLESYNKCYDLYLELKQGQVYRGIWNPNTQAYPASGGMNSYWDVVLDSGQDEVSFDGKRWFFGDRLLYVLVEDRYFQSQSGATTVKSVNGKNGAVVLTAEDLKALPITGGTLTGDVSGMKGSFTLDHKSGYMTVHPLDNTYDDGTIARLYYRAHDSGKSGVGPKCLMIQSQDKTQTGAPADINISLNGHLVYHQGFKPTPGELNVYSKPETDSIISNYYTKTEVDGKMDLKANISDISALTSTKVDKTTTVNGQPLSGNVNITLDSLNGVSKSGDTITGPLIVNGTVTSPVSIGGSNPSTGNLMMAGNDIGGYGELVGKPKASVDWNWSNSLRFYPDGTWRVGVNKVYHEGFNPTYSSVGAADSTSTTTDIKLFDQSNSSRLKEVKIYSKDNNLFTVGQDGTVAKFYNDRTYRPTASDFGGLFVENGNEVNFPLEAGANKLYLNYRQKGAVSVDTVVFGNGKAQLEGRSDVYAKDFYVAGNHKVYSFANAPEVFKSTPLGTTDLNLIQPPNLQMRIDTFNADSTNAPPMTNNANSVITLNSNPGEYYPQLAFTGLGVYTRTNRKSNWAKIYSENTKPAISDVTGLQEALNNAGGTPVLSVAWVQLRDAMWNGYVPADGQLLNRADYPGAWKAVESGKVPTCIDSDWLADPARRGCFTSGDGSTTFRVPDYNGKSSGSYGAVFLRGDGLNAFGPGTIQQDAIRNITGTFSGRSHATGYGALIGGAGVFTYQKSGGTLDFSPIVAQGTGVREDIVSLDVSRSVPTAPENRPVNAGGCWSIKLFGAVNNPGSIDAAALATQVAGLSSNITSLTEKTKHLQETGDITSSIYPTGSLHNCIKENRESRVRVLWSGSLVDGGVTSSLGEDIRGRVIHLTFQGYSLSAGIIVPRLEVPNFYYNFGVFFYQLSVENNGTVVRLVSSGGGAKPIQDIYIGDWSI